ncbi:MAG: flagellar hook-length control protein FliK, partial [Mucispirillum sp.]|nr:flagellar hook-length control protein FliK [Mucispirillum sp.]
YNMKEPRDIERLVRTMQSSVSKNQSKLTVILTPENLGKMQIQLSESGGKITAKFLLDNENSHKLIMAQSDLLKNQLAEKGIVVDNMEFAHNDAMSKQQHNDEQGRRTSKHAQKGKGVRNQENDLEVGTEVANKKATGIYA